MGQWCVSSVQNLLPSSFPSLHRTRPPRWSCPPHVSEGALRRSRSCGPSPVFFLLARTSEREESERRRRRVGMSLASRGVKEGSGLAGRLLSVSASGCCPSEDGPSFLLSPLAPSSLPNHPLLSLFPFDRHSATPTRAATHTSPSPPPTLACPPSSARPPLPQHALPVPHRPRPPSRRFLRARPLLPLQQPRSLSPPPPPREGAQEESRRGDDREGEDAP